MSIMSATAYVRNPAGQDWFFYHQPSLVLQSFEVDEVAELLAEVEALCACEQLFAVGFVSYEAAPAFDEKLATHTPGVLPLAWFALYPHRKRLKYLPETTRTFVGAWQMQEQPADYAAHVTTLRDHIGAGDVYQVNYTTRFHAPGKLDLASFADMAWGADYAAYIDTASFTIASASPELFFARTRSAITSKPMKGTAARGLSSREDARQWAWLADSIKNRAENLMITDMVRNDLGRIAVPGSVAVPELFTLEQLPRVWQMTSTVEARSQASLVEVFAALFPPASITGAPKHASMRFIAAHESEPRQVYTGAIGTVLPGGDATFSVAIRTAWSQKADQQSIYAAGGGIVWDSDPQEEYAEACIKASVLDGHQPPVGLLETMRWQMGTGYYLRERHLKRLLDSATYFAINLNQDELERVLQALAQDLCGQASPNDVFRVRLTVSVQGEIQINASPMTVIKHVQPLDLASEAVDQRDVRLYHKTLDRSIYETANRSVAKGHEALLYNRAGFVTETIIANVVYAWRGELFTPPVEDGLLPGTLRQEMLATGKCRERSLHLSEIDQVQQWYLVNALRGRRRAMLRNHEAKANAGGWR